MVTESARPDTKVTIADVARASGVSSATVSLALRNKAGIGVKTRQRVLEAAQALGYLPSFPNQSASRLPLNSIGVLIKTRPDDITMTNSFYGPVIAGIEEVCRRQQLHLMYAHLLVDVENRPVEPPRLLLEQETDGLLLVGMQINRAALALIQPQSTPMVLVDAYVESNPYDAVVIDNFAAAYEATNYLITQGHQQIALVGSQPQTFPSIMERRAGYCQAIADHQLVPYFWDCPIWPKAAYDATSTYLQRNPAPITAFFCCNDAVALSLMRALRDQSMTIPGDFSVIGFDNIDLTQHTTPALTTMRVDKVGMGRLAAQLLINRVEYPAAAQVRASLRPSLIKRQSVAPRQGS
ncbi:MAG: LacI family DNA-binding transcriptional regulator [Caldilineaceae bacterium]|nr:LacI family DNA-binding transcriptional regulator [Caldilineaceae bacterium]